MSIKKINDEFIKHENELQKMITDLAAGNEGLAAKMEAHVDALVQCYTVLLKEWLKVGKLYEDEEKNTKAEIEANKKLIVQNAKELKELESRTSE